MKGDEKKKVKSRVSPDLDLFLLPDLYNLQFYLSLIPSICLFPKSNLKVFPLIT
jgi:hypothetical protein